MTGTGGRRQVGHVSATAVGHARAPLPVRRRAAMFFSLHSSWRMQLNASVYDLWVFRRGPQGVEFLTLQSSQRKADRFFNGGTFWQVPSGVFRGGESVPQAVTREFLSYGLQARAIWAGEHAYTIYNRRFHEVQVITVFAVEVAAGAPQLNADEHQAFAWLPFEAALARVHFRGLKDGLRSVQEYITGVEHPARELCLYDASTT